MAIVFPVATAPTAEARAWRAAPVAACPSLGLLGLVAASIAAGVGTGVIGYDHKDLDPVFTGSIGLWCIAVALRRLTAHRIGAFIQLALLLLIMGAVIALASVLLATSAMPYADARLAVADRYLVPGLDWPDLMRALQRYPQSLLLLAYAYVSLGWQPFVFVATACAAGKEALAWRFATAWSLALVLTLILFPFVPATGAYVHFGITPADVPAVRVRAAWDFLPVMEGARNGAIRVLDSGTLRGIITMPSFHAAGAVILAWAFAQLRYLRWIFIVLNGAMVISAVPIGGHYCVDILAGMLIGSLCIALSDRVHRRLPGAGGRSILLSTRSRSSTGHPPTPEPALRPARGAPRRTGACRRRAPG